MNCCWLSERNVENRPYLHHGYPSDMQLIAANDLASSPALITTQLCEKEDQLLH